MRGNSIGISEYDLLNNKLGSLSNAQIREMIKLFKGKKSREMASEMIDNGIAVSKINGISYSPSHKKRVRTDTSLDRR